MIFKGEKCHYLRNSQAHFQLGGLLVSLLQPTWRYLTVTLSDHVNYQKDDNVNDKIDIDNYDDVDDFFLHQDVIWG